MKRRTGLVVGLALIALLAFAPAVPAARMRVKALSGNTWSPDYRHISKGDRIVWINKDTIIHDVKSIGRKWNKYTRLYPGDRTKKRFRKKGLYRYRCRIHSTMSNGRCYGMCGAIHVGS